MSIEVTPEKDLKDKGEGVPPAATSLNEFDKETTTEEHGVVGRKTQDNVFVPLDHPKGGPVIEGQDEELKPGEETTVEVKPKADGESTDTTRVL